MCTYIIYINDVIEVFLSWLSTVFKLRWCYSIIYFLPKQNASDIINSLVFLDAIIII